MVELSSVDPALLSQIPLFKGLDASERGELARVAHRRPFAAGQMVLSEGHVSQQLWIVLEGECEVVREERPGGAHPTMVLAVLRPFDNFGEMSFFHAMPHSASVRTRNAAVLLCLERAELNGLVSQGSPAACKLAINTVQSLAQRLRRMDDWVGELVAHEKSAARTHEWERFRQKLFNTWNL